MTGYYVNVLSNLTVENWKNAVWRAAWIHYINYGQASVIV